jgi:hypothetical protein
VFLASFQCLYCGPHVYRGYMHDGIRALDFKTGRWVERSSVIPSS